MCCGEYSKVGQECWAGARAAVLSRVAREGPFVKRTPEQSPEGSKEGGHVEKPSCIICGAQGKTKVCGPVFKCIKNFKMLMAEH